MKNPDQINCCVQNNISAKATSVMCTHVPYKQVTSDVVTLASVCIHVHVPVLRRRHDIKLTLDVFPRMEAEDSTLPVHARYAVPLEVTDPLLDHKACKGDLGERCHNYTDCIYVHMYDYAACE